MNAGAAGENEGAVVVRLCADGSRFELSVAVVSKSECGHVIDVASESVELRLCGINAGAVDENEGAVAAANDRLGAASQQ